MGAYPTSPRADFVNWCKNHADVFIAHAAAIGLTPLQATGYDTVTDAAVAAITAQQLAIQTAKIATQNANVAVAALRSRNSETVALIRAFADSQVKPDVVYSLAQIEMPSPPSPAPPPAQPTDLTVTLGASDGALTLRWKASNPTGTSGTSYIIRRRLPSESEFSFIGVSGKKEFVDETLIAGPDSVQYTVQGQRADSSGPLSPIFTVNFGQAPGGGFTATVQAGAYEASPSTVEGRVAQKVLPNGNGSGKRAKVRN